MPKLALVSQGRALKTYHIQDNSDILIGSSSSCGIRLTAPEIASEHAWILCNSGRCRIMALNEEFPVLVNNKTIKDHYLTPGDELQIGKHSLRFLEDKQADSDKPTQSATTPKPERKMEAPITPPGSDYLQVLDGKRTGKIFPLGRRPIRLGKAEGNCAVIAHRKEGYFLSHLRGPVPPMVNGNPIGEHACPLKDGNIIQIGKIRLAFHSQSH